MPSAALPPGFILDTPQPAALPPGFVLDNPPAAKPGPWTEYERPPGPWTQYQAAGAADPWAEFRPKDEWAEFRLPAPAVDVAKSAGAGAVKGAVGLGTTGAGLGNALAWAAGKAGLSPDTQAAIRAGTAAVPLPSFGVDPDKALRAIEAVTGPLYKPQTRAGRYASSIAEMAPSAIGAPGGILARGAAAVLPGAAAEAAGEAAAGTRYEPYARMAGAFGGALAPGAISRVITPNPISPARQRMVDALRAEGVTSLTAGQRTNAKGLRYAESILGDFPGSGGGTPRIQAEGQRQFTEAAVRRAGADPRLAIEGAGAAAPEVLAANSQRLGRQFNDLSARNAITFDQQFVNDVRQAVRHYDRKPTSQQGGMVQGYVDDIVGHMRAGQMPGTYYQTMRSDLSRQANNLRQSDPTLSEALRDLRNALDDAMGRSISPADRELWNETRRQYGAQKVLEKAVIGAGESVAEGNITPARLRQAVAARNGGQYARGEGDFAELARAGNALMTPLPNSGTGQRAAITTMLSMLGGGAGGAVSGGVGGAAGALGGALAPAAAGRVLMSRPVQAYLGNQAMSRRIPAGLIPRGDRRGAAALAAILAR
jgi:hypothetical protein